MNSTFVLTVSYSEVTLFSTIKKLCGTLAPTEAHASTSLPFGSIQMPCSPACVSTTKREILSHALPGADIVLLTIKVSRITLEISIIANYLMSGVNKRRRPGFLSSIHFAKHNKIRIFLEWCIYTTYEVASLWASESFVERSQPPHDGC
jgi:hypothetical protein